MNQSGSVAQTQPVVLSAAISALVKAVLVLLAAFGVVHFSSDQSTAILGVFAPLELVAAFLFVRPRVTPNAPPSKGP